MIRNKENVKELLELLTEKFRLEEEAEIFHHRAINSFFFTFWTIWFVLLFGTFILIRISWFRGWKEFEEFEIIIYPTLLFISCMILFAVSPSREIENLCPPRQSAYAIDYTNYIEKEKDKRIRVDKIGLINNKIMKIIEEELKNK